MIVLQHNQHQWNSCSADFLLTEWSYFSFLSWWYSCYLLNYFHNMHSCTLNTLLVCLTDHYFVECNKLKNNYIDMKNSKTNTVDIDDFVNKNDLIDMMILMHLNHNEISLYSDTVQIMIFCFWMLFKEMTAMLEADLTENINVIC